MINLNAFQFSSASNLVTMTVNCKICNLGFKITWSEQVFSHEYLVFSLEQS